MEKLKRKKLLKNKRKQLHIDIFIIIYLSENKKIYIKFVSKFIEEKENNKDYQFF